MKKLYIVFFCLFLLGSCKKTVEKIAQDLVVDAMTSGQWKITHFTQNGTDITANFATYTFQYYKNKTVDAINNGTPERTGTWDGDAATMTTWASFIGAPNPIALLNGSWHITNNSWTFVEATQTVGTEVKTMRLEK